MSNITKLFSFVLMILLVGSFSVVSAQNETAKENVVKVKKIKIVDGDTIITERIYTKEAKVKIDTEIDKEDIEKVKEKFLDDMETLKVYLIDSLADDIVNMKIDIDFDFEDLLGSFNLGVDTVVHEKGKTVVIKSITSNNEHIHIDEEGKHKIIILNTEDDKTECKKNKKVVIKEFEEKDVWIDDQGQEIHIKKEIDSNKAKKSIFIEKADDKKNDYHLMVHPSSSKKSVYIEFDPKGKLAELIIENDAMEVIHQENVNIVKGTYSRRIDLSKLENGTYFVYLIIEGEKYIRKIIAN